MSTKNKHRTGYRKTKLGWIPEEWNCVELNDISKKISVGLAVSVSEHFKQKGTPLIRNQNIKSGYFDSNDIIFIDPLFDKKNKSKRVQFGDVIITRTGSKIGSACVVPKEMNNAQTFTTLIVKVNKGILSSDFLVFNILSYGIKEIERLSVGGGKPNLNAGFLKRYRIASPPFQEQQKIVSILSKWDESINLTQELIQKKELQKKTLMQQLLSGKKRLKGFSDKWISTKIENAFERVTEKNKNNHQNVLTISAQHGLVSQTEYYNKNVSGASILGYYIIKKGDFAYNKSSSKGYPMGALKRLKKYDIGVVSTLYICFRLTKNTIDPDFFEHFSESGLMNRALRGIAQEGARSHGLLNMSVTDFFKIKLKVPATNKEQKAIAEVLNKADEEITELKNQLVNLQQQKKGLMQQLLTGNTRVKL